MAGKVQVGISSVIGWLVFVAGLIPMLVRLLEEGEKGLTLAGPEKWAAIISLVSLAVTQLGRYIQSALKVHGAARVEAAQIAASLPPRPPTA